MDFTIKIYRKFLSEFIRQGYRFSTFKKYINSSNLHDRFVILRHDVDRLPENSYKTATIEHELGIQSTYYFRTKPCSLNEKIIKGIETLGHEIGYHYENMDTYNGDMPSAIKDFETNLKQLREIAKIDTICMHGSPLSKWDNRDLWKKYDYKDFGIIGEPYFDVDFDAVFYLTDTGRRWDGANVSVRDKVEQNSKLKMKSTKDLIGAIEKDLLPDKIMITTHPQRWTNNYWLWAKELVLQNVKNVVKRGLVRFR